MALPVRFEKTDAFVERVKILVNIFNLKGGVWVGISTFLMWWVIIYSVVKNQPIDGSIPAAYIAIVGIYATSKGIKERFEPKTTEQTRPPKTEAEGEREAS
jgi:hypothetical protein